ncbi:MAG: sugar ABC transporter permease [Treponema sp.]|jgi:multiple sugar transport system permease protein|nr:sugar ABC transporter permease [Treponema sp.]
MKKSHVGFLCILPWFAGLLIFTLFPLVSAVYISMTDWSIIGRAVFTGLDNFIEIFRDEMFYRSLWITARYAVFAVPLKILVALTVAVALNNDYKGTGVFRTIFYMPSIVSGAAVAIVFRWVLDPGYGALNGLLRIIGVTGPDWLYDPRWVLPSYLLTTFWGASGGLFIYLAALRDVPRDLYEAATIDGAPWFRKFRSITAPLLTPIIFYNIIMELISCFRKFTDAYIMGGAGGEGTFYMVNLYQQAFSFYKMGYATALAWVLFAIILALTIGVNVTKKYWVYTE